MNYLTTITGRTIGVSSNKKTRTFILKTDSGKYRTIQFSKQEFESMKNNTGNDWNNFLKSDDYYKI